MGYSFSMVVWDFHHFFVLTSRVLRRHTTRLDVVQFALLGEPPPTENQPPSSQQDGLSDRTSPPPKRCSFSDSDCIPPPRPQATPILLLTPMLTPTTEVFCVVVSPPFPIPLGQPKGFFFRHPLELFFPFSFSF